jgi:DNA sulfur modification protein DndC
MRSEPRTDRLDEAVGRAWEVLESLRETPRWLLAFSGGKDSTTVLVLAVEFLRQQRPAGVSLEILYADTLLEIPPMARHAEGMLAHAEALAEAEGLPLRVRRLRPPPDQTFWVLVLGKGYPVPSFRFRWCTDRLKVRPMRRAAEQGDPNAVMLVGVREGESAVRDGRLRQACGRGECGPAAVGKAGPFPAVSPIREWRSCDVWDFLVFRAPGWGWPTAGLWRLYGEDEAVRYGCWLCPLVRKDRAMQAAIAAADGERPALEALAAFRERLLALSRDPGSRLPRPDGRPGRLRREAREALLAALRELEERTGLSLLSAEEEARIRRIWEEEESHGANG